MNQMLTRSDCEQRDRDDRLATLREQFELPQGLIYLDGNSLGVLPKATPQRVRQLISEEWGRDLIRSWNTAGWIDLPQRVGNKIARLVGAGPDELVVADSTSVNLFKVLRAAIGIVESRPPMRKLIVSERTNFPTDLYIAQSLAKEHGMHLLLAEPEDIPELLSDRPAILMLTHVNYRTGRQHDMAALTRAAHDNGVLTIWDLAHSAGALPVDLKGSDADFAIGCGYKYLNGGPGAPAFVWVHPRHVDQVSQPLSGWMGHAAPFEFDAEYRPAGGIQRYLCGTPPLLSMAALECGVDTVLAAEPLGGLAALREKSVALCELFIARVEACCAGHGLELRSPRDAALRGSQVSFSHADAYPVMQALIERGVIGDFRAPDILRFGFTPLYTRFVDVWDAVEQLVEVLHGGQWRDPRYHRRAAVT